MGIHRPYLPENSYKDMSIDDALGAGKVMRELVADYLAEMGVPASYVDRMFSVPPNSVDWLELEEAERLFNGYVPELEDWFRARCPALSEAESMIWDRFKDKMPVELSKEDNALIKAVGKKTRQINDCLRKEHLKVSCKAWETTFWPSPERAEFINRFAPCENLESD